MKLTAPSLTAFLLTALICIAPLHSSGQETSRAKAARLLNESKMKFTKVEEGVWTIPFQGKRLKNFDVIVAADKDILLMFVIVSNEKSFRTTPELLKKLLAHNDEFDRVKIGLDKDGLVVVRIDLSVRLADRQEFVESLDQTAAAADQVYGSIIPFLNAGK